MEFDLGWYAHPILVDGKYPAVMRERVDNKSSLQGLKESRWIFGRSFPFFNLFSIPEQLEMPKIFHRLSVSMKVSNYKAYKNNCAGRAQDFKTCEVQVYSVTPQALKIVKKALAFSPLYLPLLSPFIPRLPKFTDEESAMILNSSDFLGINMYTSYLTFPKDEGIQVDHRLIKRFSGAKQPLQTTLDFNGNLKGMTLKTLLCGTMLYLWQSNVAGTTCVSYRFFKMLYILLKVLLLDIVLGSVIFQRRRHRWWTGRDLVYFWFKLASGKLAPIPCIIGRTSAPVARLLRTL